MNHKKEDGSRNAPLGQGGKTLVLVRHAKSSWDVPGIADFDRTLNERGKNDAPEMAKRTKAKGIKLDVFLSSPAKRAHKTAKYFAEEFNIGMTDIDLIDKLYEASVTAFLEVVSTIDERHNAAIIFSHNPGITEFVNTLAKVHVDNVPTCGVFAVRADAEKWEDFLKAEKHFLFFDYPKNPLARS